MITARVGKGQGVTENDGHENGGPSKLQLLTLKIYNVDSHIRLPSFCEVVAVDSAAAAVTSTIFNQLQQT